MTAGSQAGRRSASVLLAAAVVLLAGWCVPAATAVGLAAAAPTSTPPAAAPPTSTPPAPTFVSSGSMVSVESVDTNVESSSGSGVGDPDADRRIRRIVLVLCAMAAVVALVTVLFWRATTPVPKALRTLVDLGSRAGRRKAAAAGELAEPIIFSADGGHRAAAVGEPAGDGDGDGDGDASEPASEPFVSADSAPSAEIADQQEMTERAHRLPAEAGGSTSLTGDG